MKRWCMTAVFLSCLFSRAGSASPVDESFKADVQKYLSLPDAKALAVAEDPGGGTAWGFGVGQPSIEDAVKAAMEACAQQRQHFAVKNECKVALIGNALVSSPTKDPTPSTQPQEAAHPIYENRWVNGTNFLIGSSRDVQVWVAFFKEKDPYAMVYLVNGSHAPITFAPESIQARSIRDRKDGKEETPIKTFGADEYEKKVRNRQALAAALLGAAAALSNQPQPKTSTYNGGYTVNGPNGYGYGSYYGTITQWPTASDYAAANARTAAQVKAMGSQLERSFQSMAATLMRTNTLNPGTYYGGLVHFERHRGSGVKLAVSFGGESFSFEFKY
jgi:hypothetical protein